MERRSFLRGLAAAAVAVAAGKPVEAIKQALPVKTACAPGSAIRSPQDHMTAEQISAYLDQIYWANLEDLSWRGERDRCRNYFTGQRGVVRKRSGFKA